ncbi:MAG: ABC transporter substrate-binding protein [Alphaproteobacteria bacterium]|nr:MAG: ABC transporter substrate-binding protein [Alphaproteobacteria bacterium]
MARTHAALTLSMTLLTAVATNAAIAQDTVKIGMSFAMTGAGFNAAGRQAAAGARLYLQQHGDTVAGKKIQLILRDDAGVADNARRLVQEMIVNDKVNIVAGGITPTVLAYGQLVTQAKMPTVVMISGASVTTTASPYFVRTSFILSQSSWIMGEWASKNGSKRVVTLVNEWAPGTEAETSFKQRFTELGGQVIESIRIPLANPDFAPFLQRIRDLNPDTAFIYFPGTQAGIFAKQFAERGLASSGIKIIGPGDLTDDDELNGMGDQMLGLVTAHDYSAAHDSPLNKKYVEDFKKANSFRPNFVSVGGYDGMHLIYEALRKTGGKTDGDTLIAAMKGMKWESPRGMMSIDPETRDIIQDIYIRKVEKLNGELWNVEFDKFADVKDPLKVKK